MGTTILTITVITLPIINTGIIAGIRLEIPADFVIRTPLATLSHEIHSQEMVSYR